MGIDVIKDFYLQSTMLEPEWMCVPVALLPQVIIDTYRFQDKIKNGREIRPD